ncbi:MAG: ATP-binding cassette domain-containing protein [Burkholderiaceae bacterium]|jgi:ABC-2 type transport system ATP-binding protein
MIVRVQKLTKCFVRKNDSPFTAVDAIDFSIASGERVAFIGPNGAGKSTTLKMLTGILQPTSGNAEVAGFVPWKQRQKLASEIGIVFGQRSQLWYHLPVRDSFELLSKIYDVSRAAYSIRLAYIVEILRIESLLDQPVKSLSLGQRMRCEIAATLLHKPKILFLDEPTIGLDVTAKALLREHLKHLADSEETTILLTSHDTGDIEEICNRVILINDGRILLDKPLAELRSEFLSTKQITLVTDEEHPSADFGGAIVVSRDHHRVTLSVDQTRHPIDRVLSGALQQLSIRDVTIENAPLEAIIRDLYGGRR